MIAAVMNRFHERARRMGQMMHRLDVDVVELARRRHGMDFANARSTCAACRHTEICDRAHDDWLAGRVSAAPDGFCPNAGLLAAYREQPGKT
jgi:hypothetical protein